MPTALQMLESARSACSETGWSLPPAIAAFAECYEEQAHAFLSRAPRRRAARRMAAAIGTVLLILESTAAGLDDESAVGASSRRMRPTLVALDGAEACLGLGTLAERAEKRGGMSHKRLRSSKQHSDNDTAVLRAAQLR